MSNVVTFKNVTLKKINLYKIKYL